MELKRIMNFLLQAHPDFVQEAFKESGFVNHLQSKLNGYCNKEGYMSPTVITMFMSSLDNKHLNMLETYIENNKIYD